MKNVPSPRELAEEALAALRAHPMTPEEHFEFLVQQGIIDRNGRVLVAKLFGEASDQADPPTPPTNGSSPGKGT